MMALAGMQAICPASIVPGGVTLPARDAEDAGQVQSLGARFSHDLITLDYAATMGCRACGSSGGGCQFLGTAATSQVVAEALGLALPHSALAPSGEPVWFELATPLGARAACGCIARHLDRPDPHACRPSRTRCSCTRRSAARRICCCTSRRSPHAAGLPPPTVEDWIRVNRATPRLVDALPNGPRGHPTVQVFMAGGVPEVMLHLRRMGLLHGDVLTATGDTLDTTLDWWEVERAPAAARARLASAAAIDPDDVIMIARRGAARRSHQHRRLSARQPCAARARSSRRRPSIRRWSTAIGCIGIAVPRACSPTSATRSRR